MQRAEVRGETAGTSVPEAGSDLDTFGPASPLSIRRDKPVDSFCRVLSGTGIWAGAFRDSSSSFHSMRFETVAQAGLPYFLYTLRSGHLFSSCAPFAFPLDLLPDYGPPGELTVLSTGNVLATLRLAWTVKSGIASILKRDAEFSSVLTARLQRQENGVSQASFQMPP